MVKYLLLLVSISALLIALPLEVSSDSMKAVDEKKQAHFIDNVKLTQDKSWLTCNLLIVHFDDNKTAKEYEAIENVVFEIHQNDSIYKGSSNKVLYDPIDERFTFIGSAIIEDTLTKRKSEGERIAIDLKGEKVQSITMGGAINKPVKMTFDVGAKK